MALSEGSKGRILLKRMVILGMENFLDFLILGALIFISILLFSIVQSNEKSKKIYKDLVGLPSPRLAIFIILFFAVLMALGLIVGFGLELVINELKDLYNDIFFY